MTISSHKSRKYHAEHYWRDAHAPVSSKTSEKITPPTTHDLNNGYRSVHALRIGVGIGIPSSGNAGENLSIETDAVTLEVEVDSERWVDRIEM